MSTQTALLRRASSAAVLALALALGASPSTARADAVDDLATVLDYTGGIPGIPVTGQDIRDSKKMFLCIDSAKNDIAVATCVDGALDTPLGKKAATQAGLPSWFGKLVEVYVDVRTEDWWALIEDAGMTVACAAAQVLAAGTDVCGIAQTIIEIAGAAKEAFDDAVAFLEDLGCAVGIACDPATPREAVAYGLVFEPRIPDGLKARKDVDGFAFPKLRNQLEQNALAKPAKLSVPAYPLKEEFTEGQVGKASAAWVGAVDKQWTADMFKTVLPDRSTRQIEYGTAASVATVATAAANAYLASPKATDAYKFAVDTCAITDLGKTYGYAHVDRWMQEYPNEAKKFAGLKSNHDWCVADFFAKNIAGFAKTFRDRLAATNTCAALGTGLLCPTLAKYETCLGLMKSAGQAAQCGVNVPEIGKELADKLNKHFVEERKSKYAPCRLDLPTGGAPASAKPAAFVCKRPTLQHFCKQQLAELWKHPIPAPLVCVPPELEPAYAALAGRVKQAAAELQAKYPSVGVDAIDPLVVHAGKPEVFAALKGADSGKPQRASPDSVDFQYQVAFTLTIDGASRAMITGDLATEPAVTGAVVPATAASALGVKPADPDPVLRTSPALGTVTPRSAPAIGSVQSPLSAAAPPSRVAPSVGSTPLPLSSAAPPSRAVPATDSAPSRMGAPAQPSPVAPAATQSPPGRQPQSATTPNWNAAAPARAVAPPPTTGRAQSVTAPAAVASAAAAIQKDLAAASCVQAAGGMRFTCTTRAGFDRCESLRKERKVEQCTLDTRR